MLLFIAPTTFAQSSTPTASQQTYIVLQGENLFQIALRYDVTMDDLAVANGITDIETIYVGQVLIIPSAATAGEAIITPTPPTLTPTISGQVGTTSSVEDPPPSFIFPTPAARPETIILNGIPIGSIIVAPGSVLRNAREIYRAGQTLGKDANSFSKLGDSIIEHPFFLARFDAGSYNLGEYGYLQAVINTFAGSYGRSSIAVQRGLHVWSVLDPFWADRRICEANEHILACEFRENNPSILFIRLGSNERGVPGLFESSMRGVIEFSVAEGVIPVLITKADRGEGGDNLNNNILRQLATEYSIPLIDFDNAAVAIPGRGLSSDGIHLTTFYAHDYTLDYALERGHGVHNLVALIMLDTLWQEVIQVVEEEDWYKVAVTEEAGQE